MKVSIDKKSHDNHTSCFFDTSIEKKTSLFLTPKHHFFASDCFYSLSVPAYQITTMQTMIKSIFDKLRIQGYQNPILFGLIPFDKHHHAYLNFYGGYEQLVLSDYPEMEIGAKIQEVVPVTSQMIFMDAVHKGLKAFEQTPLKKVVLSQAVDCVLSKECSANVLAFKLFKQNPFAYTFAIPITSHQFMIGASPELLLAKQGNIIQSNPLAGSRPLDSHYLVNEKRQEELCHSDKDLFEHAMVTQHVYQTLAPWTSSLNSPEPPHIIYTSTMMHLSTVFQGVLKDADTNLLNMALDLHPTPAVCGTPNAMAQDFIFQHEGYDRGFYAGMAGWMDAEGNGEWIVTIRCGLLNNRTIRLYAGAGIVKGSDAQAEWQETEAKMQTMLNLFR